MEKKGKGKIIVIIVLLLLTLGLAGYIVYDKTIEKNDNAKLQDQIKKLNKEISSLKTNEDKKTDSDKMNSIVGVYSYTQNNANGPSSSVTIDFMEDGTYYKKESSTAAEIAYGTYTTDGNKITLNQVYTHSNDFGSGQKSTKTYIYEINNDGTLSGNDEYKKFVLTKTNKTADIKKELMDWLIDDAEEYNKTLSKGTN